MGISLLVVSSATSSVMSASSSKLGRSNFWIPELELFIEDRLILNNSLWLNDNNIRVAQLLLQKEFGSTVCGWQSTQFSKCPALFRDILDSNPFIQILHVNNSHWITISNMPFKKESNSVYIYDSLTPGSISDSLFM